jgi:hypothetical protein
MPTYRRLQLSLVLVSASALALLYACGGDDTSSVAAAGDASPGSDASMTVDSGGGTDTGSSDAGLTDTGSDTGSTDASDGSLSTPGIIVCGAGTCNTATEYCCNSASIAGGASCYLNSDAGCGASGGVPYHCDEAADCRDAGICCHNGFNGLSHAPDNVCAASCVGVQECGTTAECVNGGPCIPQTSCHGFEIGYCDASVTCPP